MGAKEQIEAAFGAGKSLYEVLGVAADANPAAIRKAYFKMALTCVRWVVCLWAGLCCAVLYVSLSTLRRRIPTHPPHAYPTQHQHPDKCQDDPAATAKFQALSVVHATLSDAEKRKLYDETGEVEEEGAEELSKSEREWYDYFRALFPKVRGCCVVVCCV